MSTNNYNYGISYARQPFPRTSLLHFFNPVKNCWIRRGGNKIGAVELEILNTMDDAVTQSVGGEVSKAVSVRDRSGDRMVFRNLSDRRKELNNTWIKQIQQSP